VVERLSIPKIFLCASLIRLSRREKQARSKKA
jgi:hypothetical protein